MGDKIPLLDEQDCIKTIKPLLQVAAKENEEFFKKFLLESLALILFTLTSMSFILRSFVKAWVFVALTIPYMLMSFANYRYKTKAFRKKIEMYKRSLSDLRAIKSLVENKSNYIFYLRDYDTGASSYSTPFVYGLSKWGGDTIGYIDGSLSLMMVTSQLSEFFPIVMLNNSRDKTANYDGLILHCSDESWFNNFKLLADNSTTIVIDYNIFFDKSDPIIEEIKYIKHLDKPIIAVGHQTTFDYLKEKYPDLYNKIRFFVKRRYKKGHIDEHSDEIAFSDNLREWLLKIM